MTIFTRPVSIGITLFASLVIGCAGTEADDDVDPQRDSGPAAIRDGGPQATRDGGPDSTRDGGPGGIRDGGPGNTRDGGARDGGSQNMRDGGTRDAGMAPPRDAGPRPVTCNPTFGPGDSCGGGLVGTWTYRVACTNDNVFENLRQACPGIVFSNQVVSTGGTVDLRADSTFTRNVSTDVTADSTWPQVCVQVTGNCAGLEATINSSGTTTASCSNNGSQCDCILSTNIGTFDNGSYVINGNVVIAGGLEYDYCAAGGVIEYRGTPNNQTDNLFTFVLSR